MVLQLLPRTLLVLLLPVRTLLPGQRWPLLVLLLPGGNLGLVLLFLWWTMLLLPIERTLVLLQIPGRTL
mgnify:CR=1 FL=1